MQFLVSCLNTGFHLVHYCTRSTVSCEIVQGTDVPLRSCSTILLRELQETSPTQPSHQFGLGVDYSAEQGDTFRMQEKKGMQNTAKASAFAFLSKCDWNVGATKGKRWKSGISARICVLHSFL